MSKNVKEFLDKKLGIQEKIESAAKIDIGQNNNGVLVRLSDFKKKNNNGEKKDILRGTQIFIDDDFTKEERRIQVRIKKECKRRIK